MTHHEMSECKTDEAYGHEEDSMNWKAARRSRLTKPPITATEVKLSARSVT